MNKEKLTIKYRAKNSGFSFIELIVVISVFAILSLITISGFSGYDEKIKFEQLTLNIAIAIRQAQNYGTSSVDYVLNNFDPDDIETVNPIGIHFEYDRSITAFKPQITLFKDVNKGGGITYSYDEFFDSKIDTVNIPYIKSISKICMEEIPNVCTPFRQSISLFFKRPYPEPYLEGLLNQDLLDQGNLVVPATPLSFPVRIELLDETKNEIWAIRIEPTGLISVSPKQAQ